MMAKVSAKNGIILINGYNYSTYATSYEASDDSGLVDVTGFGDGGKNFIPGLPSAELNIAMLWDSTATVGVHAVLSAFPSGHVTLMPEGYALGNPTISLPYMLGNYNPQGKPDDAVRLGTLKFAAAGANVGLENGVVLAHATITNTTTGTGFVDRGGIAITAACGATLHIWTKCAADTYAVKVQHCATIGGVYSDLITFTANGSALTSERQTLASGVIQPYRRVLATRTGANNNPFGYSVHFWHALGA
jgi:hypothetical protein